MSYEQIHVLGAIIIFTCAAMNIPFMVVHGFSCPRNWLSFGVCLGLGIAMLFIG